MQYKIPQDVQRADTIIGSITMLQLGELLIGGGFGYAAYLLLAKTYEWYIAAIPAGIIGVITLAVAFLKIADMSFIRFTLYFTEYNLKPKERYWKKNDGEFFYSILKPMNYNGKADKQVVDEISPDEKRKKLQEITKLLDQ